MEPSPSRESLIPVFEELWNARLIYQKERGAPVWPDFPDQVIRDEIYTGKHWFYEDAGEVLGYFSLCDSDPLIWKERNADKALYIHRMVSRQRSGFPLAKNVFEWVMNFAKTNGVQYVRMDTWGDNSNLIKYYEEVGFKVLAYRQLGVEPELPAHYSNANLVTFQNEI